MNAVELPTFILGVAAAIAGVAAIAGGKDWKFRAPAAVLCLVLILGAVVLAVSAPWTGTAGTAGAGSPSTTTATPVTTTTTVPPPTTTTTEKEDPVDLDEDQTELLESLNTDDGAFDPDSCEAESGDNSDVEIVATISCDAYGLEDDLWVSEFPDRQNYVRFFRQVSGEMTNQGLCGVVQQSSVTWDRDGVTIGNLVCYPADHKQWFVWFCANTRTVASASAADLASLYAWWNSYANVLPCGR